MATTLGRRDPLVTWLHEVTWLIKSDISPPLRGLWLRKFTRWMFIVNSHHPLSLLLLWSRDQVITWQMKNLISQLPRDLWLTEWWVLMRAYYLSSLITSWSRGHIRSHDKWKNVTNSLSRDLLLSKLAEEWLMIRSHMSNHKATYSFDHVVTWVHVTNELRYIFTSTMPIATKLNRVMACNEESPLKK